MARVTVEDCKKIIPNHFELVVLASRRGRDISTGSPLLVERSNDKNGVIALREIAAKKFNVEQMRENLLHELRKNKPQDDNLDDNKQENYLELEGELDTKFTQSFADEFDDEADFQINENEFLEDNMSFEDADISSEE
jgi:DNA-directed RNA polymerase subunit omega